MSPRSDFFRVDTFSPGQETGFWGNLMKKIDFHKYMHAPETGFYDSVAWFS